MSTNNLIQANNFWKGYKTYRICIVHLNKKGTTYVKFVFLSRKHFLANEKHSLQFELKLTSLNTSSQMCSVFLHGVEMWMLTDTSCKTITALEILCYRKMMWVSSYRVTIARVLNEIGLQRTVLGEQIILLNVLNIFE